MEPGVAYTLASPVNPYQSVPPHSTRLPRQEPWENFPLYLIS